MIIDLVGDFYAPALYDQLVAGIPSLAPVACGDGSVCASLLIDEVSDGLRLHVPDGTDEGAVRSVAAAHDAASARAAVVPPPAPVATRVAEALDQVASLPVTTLGEASVKIDSVVAAVRQALLSD